MLKFVFIIGSQRSGTTLMGQIFGAHPSAILIDENDGLYDWTSAVFENDHAELAQDAFTRCCQSAKLKYRVQHTRFRSDGRPTENVTHIALKAPNLTYSYAEIARNLGNCSIIYMVRDIRDVVASMKQLPNIPMVENQLRLMMSKPHIVNNFANELSILQDPAVEHSTKMAIVAKVKMSLAGYFRDAGLDTLQVRYEDLVNKPKVWIDRIMEHSKIKPSKLCFRHEEVLCGVGPGRTIRSRPVDSKSIGNWNTGLKTDEEAAIWRAVGEHMTQLGYHRERQP